MGYKIEKGEAFFEVRLFGDVSRYEILLALAQLVRRDPKKQYPDVWVATPEVQLPLPEHNWVVGKISSLFMMKRPVSRKTAIVASNAFQKAQFDMYREAASVLPADVGVFQSRDEAIAWVQKPEAQPSV